MAAPENGFSWVGLRLTRISLRIMAESWAFLLISFVPHMRPVIYFFAVYHLLSFFRISSLFVIFVPLAIGVAVVLPLAGAASTTARTYYIVTRGRRGRPRTRGPTSA